ncbi:MAG: T9SS type A sorting domain-containing protein [Bacteroidia bacterium]|nr:T9SS type A sorting domain-containing protein [Bacteroidia bacterium]
MKRKITLISAFIIFSFSFSQTNGQAYHKLLDNNSWYEYVYGFTGGAYYWYYKSNDTLINSVNYTIIRLSTAQAEYYLREDTVNKKVYQIQPPNPEYVLYDFSLLPSATFIYQSVTFQLDSINSFLTPLGNRNKFYYHNVANPSFRAECIEGIGSTEEPMTFKVFISDPVWVLICSYVGTTQYYYNGLDTCPPNIYTSIAEQEAMSLLSIYPNPATNEIRIQNSAFRIKNVEVFDALGEKHNSSFNILNSEFTIDVSSLRSGIYFITLTDETGNRVVSKVVKM